MDHLGKLGYLVDRDVVEKECAINIFAQLGTSPVVETPFRALDRLFAGVAHNVISSALDEQFVEAWHQLAMRFEPELEVQATTLLVNLRSISAATSIEETKNKFVKIKSRICCSEDIRFKKSKRRRKRLSCCKLSIRNTLRL